MLNGGKTTMEDNAFEKFKSMINSGNIPEELQSILSNISSSNKTDTSSNKNSGISPEAINNLMSMINSKSSNRSNDSSAKDSNFEEHETSNKDENNSNSTGIDFETIMKFKNMMDKINSRDDPRSKLLISLKPYLKDSRKNKVDQYIQFFKMSNMIDILSKSNGDDK